MDSFIILQTKGRINDTIQPGSQRLWKQSSVVFYITSTSPHASAQAYCTERVHRAPQNPQTAPGDPDEYSEYPPM